MDFKKRFDYNDINNFLPDNLTIGNVDYYLNKFDNKLDEEDCEKLAVLSRVEYKDEDVKEIISEIDNRKKEREKSLIQEYIQIEEEAKAEKEKEEVILKNIEFIKKKFNSVLF